MWTYKKILCEFRKRKNSRCFYKAVGVDRHTVVAQCGNYRVCHCVTNKIWRSPTKLISRTEPEELCHKLFGYLKKWPCTSIKGLESDKYWKASPLWTAYSKTFFTLVIYCYGYFLNRNKERSSFKFVIVQYLNTYLYEQIIC